jgi:hypothetical protein
MAGPTDPISSSDLNTETSDITNETRMRLDRRLTPGTPLWVKVLGIIALLALVLFVILHLAGGGMGGH